MAHLIETNAIKAPKIDEDEDNLIFRLIDNEGKPLDCSQWKK